MVFITIHLTEKNYAAAITLLKQRFGNRNVSIHAHLNNLLNMSPIKNITDIHGLRNSYDKSETQICSLEALGELALDFTRIQDNDKKLDVQTLINLLRDEIKSREKAFQIHKSELKQAEIKPQRDVRM
ncbi:uncharacterized protein NPIL_677851 [Nephila pilipes]|uniref:Uncharacterized protein n=1 Tax=Nephila pilipes TaxID=299642 RepID=A0A8X6PIX6_NEPPI|nr:uncharacterized protein NPIL_677851 [Nephila pilipes]